MESMHRWILSAIAAKKHNGISTIQLVCLYAELTNNVWPARFQSSFILNRHSAWEVALG